MVDLHKLSNQRSPRGMRRDRQIMGFAIVLFAIVLGGPQRLSAQCTMINNIAVSVSPATVYEGHLTTLTVTFTLNTPVSACNTLGADMYDVVWGARTPDGHLVGTGDVWIGFGEPSGHVTVTTSGYGVTVATRIAFIVEPYTPAYIEDIPSGQPAEPGANLGVCPSGNTCSVAHPINITNGNVWIPQRDYSIPGLGGGLELSRVWNSRWMYAAPPAYAGMFGVGWRSTYEEQLYAVDSQTIQYWRADGGAWTFTYNPTLSTYSISSPPNERAQLVFNSGSGVFLH